MTFLLGLLSGLAVGLAFILFALWHSKRHPIVSPEPEILAAETIIHCPPAYGLRIVK